MTSSVFFPPQKQEMDKREGKEESSRRRVDGAREKKGESAIDTRDEGRRGT